MRSKSLHWTDGMKVLACSGIVLIFEGRQAGLLRTSPR